MFSGLFSHKCGMTLIASSFVSLFMLGGLSPVSASENGHQYLLQVKKHGWRVYIIDKRIKQLQPAFLPTIIEEPSNQTNGTLG